MNSKKERERKTRSVCMHVIFLMRQKLLVVLYSPVVKSTLISASEQLDGTHIPMRALISPVGVSNEACSGLKRPYTSVVVKV